VSPLAKKSWRKKSLRSTVPATTAPPRPTVQSSTCELGAPSPTRCAPACSACRLDGPSTSTRLGQRVDESSGSTSYHLRQLAAQGFVEDVVGHGAGRERGWRAAHRMTSWEPVELLGQEGGQVQDDTVRLQTAAHGRVLSAWVVPRDGLDSRWRPAGAFKDYQLRLTPGQARDSASSSTPSSSGGLPTTPPTRRPTTPSWSASSSTSCPLREWPT